MKVYWGAAAAELDRLDLVEEVWDLQLALVVFDPYLLGLNGLLEYLENITANLVLLGYCLNDPVVHEIIDLPRVNVDLL